VFNSIYCIEWKTLLSAFPDFFGFIETNNNGKYYVNNCVPSPTDIYNTLKSYGMPESWTQG
jgi:hypothetical protein